MSPDERLELDLDVDLALDDDDTASASAKLAVDDAEGPIDPIDVDDDLPPLPDLLRGPADDLLGIEGHEEEGFGIVDDELDARSALAASDDGEGPLLDEEGDLGLSEQDEPLTAVLGSDDEGVLADEAAYDLDELPPLGEDRDDGALFDEAFDDLDLEPEPPLGPPALLPSTGVQERLPPT